MGMVNNETPEECRALAARERELAAAATLRKVREKHLAAARQWEELAGPVEKLTKLRKRTQGTATR